MKYTIDPGRKRPSVNFIDSIVYSRKPDLDGNMLDLEMSIMLQNGNSEMRLAAGSEGEDRKKYLKPAILWVPGGGYRTRRADRHRVQLEILYGVRPRDCGAV